MAISLNDIKKFLSENQNAFELLPLDRDYERVLAYLEYHVFENDTERIHRLAYFKSINNTPTLHYSMYQHYKRFDAGYALHNLYPFLGKFHPQFVKALLNIINLKPYDSFLDPFSGSGTGNLESLLLNIGIKSYAIDVNPVAQLIEEVKYIGLHLSDEDIQELSKNSQYYFSVFSLSSNIQEARDTLGKCTDLDKIALLCYLDSIRYVDSFPQHPLEEVFKKNYLQYLKRFMDYNSYTKHFITNSGTLTILNHANALNIDLPNNSLDGFITTPPYVDYIDFTKKHLDQLKYLKIDIENLKYQNIGLKGNTEEQKQQYFMEDMFKACSEIYRVLKHNRFFILVIGTQTKFPFNSKDNINLNSLFQNICCKVGFDYLNTFEKPLTNNKRKFLYLENILFFYKE